MGAVTQLPHTGALQRSPRWAIRQVCRRPQITDKLFLEIVPLIKPDRCNCTHTHQHQATLQFAFFGQDVHAGQDALVESANLHASLRYSISSLHEYTASHDNHGQNTCNKQTRNFLTQGSNSARPRVHLHQIDVAAAVIQSMEFMGQCLWSRLPEQLQEKGGHLHELGQCRHG